MNAADLPLDELKDRFEKLTRKSEVTLDRIYNDEDLFYYDNELSCFYNSMYNHQLKDLFKDKDIDCKELLEDEKLLNLDRKRKELSDEVLRKNDNIINRINNAQVNMEALLKNYYLDQMNRLDESIDLLESYILSIETLNEFYENKSN